MRKANYFYVFPSYAMAKKALWQNIDGQGFRTLDHLHPSLVVNKNNQEQRLELVNGSIIQMVGIEQADTLRGVAAAGVVFSEFAFQHPEGYKIFMPVLRESNGWALFNSTPDGKNHFYDLEERVKDSENWHVSILQTAWPDKPHYSGLITPENLQLVQEEEGLTEEQIQQEYGVSYTVQAKGSYYGDLIDKAETEGRIGEFGHDSSLPVDTFWDLGKSDDTAIWFVQRVGNKVIFIDYHEESGKSIDHYAYVLRNKGYRYGTHFLPHDATHNTIGSSGSTVELFQKYCKAAGVEDNTIIAGRRPIQEGIQAVRSRFPRYHFNAGLCEEGIKKLSLYHRKWDSKRQVFLQQPVHDFTSHTADALRTEAITEEDHDKYQFDNLEFDTVMDISGDYDPF